MAESKLTRKLLKQFASTAAAGEIDVFGSLAAGALATSTDPDTIQSLSQWLDGWAEEVVDDENPVLEDRNAVDFVYAYMLKTLFQMGIPEYLATETYFIGSIVNSAGVLYRSRANSNIGQSLSNSTYWVALGNGKSLNPQVVPTLAARAVATWTNRVDSAPTGLKSICWSPELNLFCAVDFGGTGDLVVTSPDGITWTARTDSEDNQWQSVCWSPELGLFVVVGLLLSTNTHAVMTSPDGSTWTNRTASTNQNWRSVCYSPSLKLLVAVGTTTLGAVSNVVMSSANGTAWTNRTAAASKKWSSVCWSEKLQLFVAVSDDIGAGGIMTSPDGNTWTTRTSPSAQAWSAVCWSEDLGMFLAVEALAASGVTAYSFDGITWAAGTDGALAISWQGLTWAPEIGLFIVVGVSGGGAVGNVMTSPDGLVWTTRTPSQNNSWTAVAWAPQLGIAAAVAEGGANMIMTSEYVQKFIAP